jgi:hypothetical protein
MRKSQEDKKMTKFGCKIFLIVSILFIAVGIPTTVMGYAGGVALLLFGIANIIVIILLHKERNQRN